MIRRLLSWMCRRDCYLSKGMIERNIRAWWSSRGGWVVGSLIRDELFTLRCVHALKGGAA